MLLVDVLKRKARCKYVGDKAVASLNINFEIVHSNNKTTYVNLYEISHADIKVNIYVANNILYFLKSE